MTLPTILEHCAIKNRRTSQKLLCHCEGQRPVAIRSLFVPSGGRAVRSTAGDADCHVASLLAMTVVIRAVRNEHTLH